MTFNVPTVSEEQLESSAERKKILAKLQELSDQVRHMMYHLDEDNFSDSINEKLEAAANAPTEFKHIKERQDSDGTKNKATFQVQADQILARVEKDNIISEINQSAELIKILAPKIALEGYTSVNGYFIITEDGKVIIHSVSGSDSTTIQDGIIRTTYAILNDGVNVAYLAPQLLTFGTLYGGSGTQLNRFGLTTDNVTTLALNGGTPITSDNISDYVTDYASSIASLSSSISGLASSVDQQIAILDSRISALE